VRVTIDNTSVNSSNQLSREAVLTHLDSYCFKREFSREAIYSTLVNYRVYTSTSYYLLPDRVVKRDFGKARLSAVLDRQILTGGSSKVDTGNQTSESPMVDKEDIQNLLRKATLNMNPAYRSAKDLRKRMDAIDWRTQRVFKVLRRRLSIDRFNQTVRFVGRLSRVARSDWLDEAEVLYEL